MVVIAGEGFGEGRQGVAMVAAAWITG